jgi:hypothetical protein
MKKILVVSAVLIVMVVTAVLFLMGKKRKITVIFNDEPLGIGV